MANRFNWSPEDIQFLRDNPQMYAREVSAKLGCTRWAVCSKRAEIRRAERGGRKPSIARKYAARAHQKDKKREARMVALTERIAFLKRWKERVR